MVQKTVSVNWKTGRQAYEMNIQGENNFLNDKNYIHIIFICIYIILYIYYFYIFTYYIQL